MDKTGEHHVKRNNPNSENHELKVFSYMWKLDGNGKMAGSRMSKIQGRSGEQRTLGGREEGQGT